MSKTRKTVLNFVHVAWLRFGIRYETNEDGKRRIIDILDQSIISKYDLFQEESFITYFMDEVVTSNMREGTYIVSNIRGEIYKNHFSEYNLRWSSDKAVKEK